MTDYLRWQKSNLVEALNSRRVIMMTGARQCGKTTLARTLISSNISYRTLDDQSVLQSAKSDPHQFVNSGSNVSTLIIDEVQKAPTLLSAIKKIIDLDNRSGQFLITGSAAILSLPTIQESLAGRVGMIRLRPLTQGEITGSEPFFIERAFKQDFIRGQTHYDRMDLVNIIFRGGFPEAMRLRGRARIKWHIDYIDALIVHDLKDVTNIKQIDIMRDLVRVLAAWSSKFIDISAIGAKMSTDRRTLASYISALEALYIVETVPAWQKTDYDRVGKQKKLFMTDTGLMSALLGWKTSDFNDDSDKLGKAFETFAFNEIKAQIEAAEDVYRLYQYRDKNKREIDFLIERDDNHLLAIEIKSGLTVAKSDFKHIQWFSDNLAKGNPLIGIVLYAGDEILPFGKNLWAVPFDCIWGI